MGTFSETFIDPKHLSYDAITEIISLSWKAVIHEIKNVVSYFFQRKSFGDTLFLLCTGVVLDV